MTKFSSSYPKGGADELKCFSKELVLFFDIILRKNFNVFQKELLLYSTTIDEEIIPNILGYL